MSSLTSILNTKSLAIAGGMALAAGIIIFVAARAARFTSSVALYHGIIYAAFWGMYMFIPGGFAANFTMPDSLPKDMSAADVAYYTMVTHSGVGYGDVTPKTPLARQLVTAHLFFVILAIFNMVPVGKSTFSYAAFG